MLLANYFKRIKAIWHPAMFQGWGKKSNYFEGWYYKIVTADQRHAYAIIPGIALHHGDRHAFIQTMDGIAKTAEYTRFDLSAFDPNAQMFAVSIGDNKFSSSDISIDLPHIQGRLSFKNLQNYNGSIFSPGIMGWYSFVPFMQCYHGLVSIGHKIEGQMQIRDKVVDFTGG
ncbi:MAG: hypothetical protein HKN76_02765, partial [Saprospiraceae bacterium]|nr:hypothetical protein [Saprospiraceae bacterium]